MSKGTKRLVFLGTIYSIGSVFEKGLSFFLIPVYTAFLGTEEYGVIGLLSITIQLAMKLFESPVLNGFNRYYYSPILYGNKGKLIFNSFVFLLFSGLIFAIVFYSFSLKISFLVLGNYEFAYIVKCYSFLLFFQPLSDFFLALLRLEEKSKYLVLVDWTRSIVMACVTTIGLIAMNWGVLAVVLGQLFGVLISILLIFPYFFARCSVEFDFYLLKLPLIFGLPFIPTALSIFLIQSADRYILQLFGALSIVGIYAFGYQIADIILFALVKPLKQALLPMAFKKEDNQHEFKHFVEFNCIYFYLLGMFICLFLSIFSMEFIYLIAQNEEFYSGWVIVPIIAFSHLQHAMGSFFGLGTLMAKKSWYISMNTFFALFLNIGLNFLFIPLLGIIGAALATLFSYFLWNILKMYFSAKFYNLNFELLRLLKITVVGIGLYLCSLYLTFNFDMYYSIIGKFILILIYFPAFFFIGFFNEKEMQYIKSFFSSVKNSGIASTIQKIRKL